MANSYGQFTLWVSVSNILKSELSCTSHKLWASLWRWQVWGRLQHGKCPHAATKSYVLNWSEHTFWGLQDYNFDNTGFECPYWDEKMCLKLSLKLHKYQYLILRTCIYQPPPRLLLASVNTGWEVMRSLWKLCRFTNLILGSDPRHPHTTVKHSPPPPGYIVYYVTSFKSLRLRKLFAQSAFANC